MYTIYYPFTDDTDERVPPSKMFVGSVTDPQQVLSFDIILDNEFYPSSLFDTIVTLDSETSYTIHNIQYPNVISTTMQFPEIKKPESNVKFYLSYDGKTIAEFINLKEGPHNNIRVFNNSGQLLANTAIGHDENILAITNNVLITHNYNANKLNIWPLASLSNSVHPSLRLTLSSNYSYPDELDEKVTLGEDNTFLLSRNTIHSTTAGDKNRVKSFEWTKYSIGYKGDMNQFLDSLIQK